MSWGAVNAFLEELPPIESKNFPEWWEQHWFPYQKKCFNAASQHFIVEKSVHDATNEEELDTLMREAAITLQLDVEDFMSFAWPHALKKFTKKREAF